MKSIFNRFSFLLSLPLVVNHIPRIILDTSFHISTTPRHYSHGGNGQYIDGLSEWHRVRSGIDRVRGRRPSYAVVILIELCNSEVMMSFPLSELHNPHNSKELQGKFHKTMWAYYEHWFGEYVLLLILLDYQVKKNEYLRNICS